MRSTFYGLEVARTGLYTAQNQLNTAGHNISNVDTEGYTRQRVNTAAIPAQACNLQIAVDSRSTSGRGVNTINISQIRSAFTDAKYRAEKSSTSYYSTRANEFSMVEQIFSNVFSEKSGSINSALLSFYYALGDLAGNDNSAEYRQVLKEAGIQLCESINYVYSKLEQQHDNINSQISVTVDQINGIADSIANLNKQIFGYELTGAIANDLRDQRNLLLDELSGLVDIEYYSNAKGQMVVTIGGRELVSGAEYNKLCVNPAGADNKLDVEGGIDPPSKQYTVCWADALGNPEKQVHITGGALKGYFDVRDGDTENCMGIPYIAKQLNDLVRKIAKEINAAHRLGYTMPYTEEEALGLSDPAFHTMNADGTIDINANGRYNWDTQVQPVAYPEGATGADVEYWYYESRQGADFFYAGENDDYKTITAKNFRLSDEVMSNINLIASSTDKILVTDQFFTNGNQYMGNTENMSNILALFDAKDATGKENNFESILSSLVAMIGNQANHLNSLDSAQQVRMRSIEQERASESSVSLDEEMTDMIRFQHAYNASSRVITAIDEQLDTLINKMGTVGR